MRQLLQGSSNLDSCPVWPSHPPLQEFGGAELDAIWFDMAFKNKQKEREYKAKWYAENREITKQRATAWKRANPKRKRELDIAWAKANPQKVKASANRWAKKWHVENREESIAKCKAWREANPKKMKELKDAWNRANQDRVKASFAAWCNLNPGKIRANRNRRRARKLNTHGNHNAVDIGIIKSILGNACLCCGATENITIDHIKPLARGGGNGPTNLQPLCKLCNCKKHCKRTDYRSEAQKKKIFETFQLKLTGI